MSLVSIIIPVYNGERFITRAVDSALTQHFSDFEVIVVDDGSTDSTAHILSEYGSKICSLRQKNYGPAAARNAGAAIAQGDYLAFLDADDCWRGDKLTLTHRALESHATAALAFSGFHRITIDGIELGDFRYEKAPSFDDMFTRRFDMAPSTVVIRRPVFERCGGFCNELQTFEDSYLWLLAREQGEFIYMDDLLVSLHTRASVCSEDWHTEPCASWFRNAKKFERLVLARYGYRALPVIRQNKQDLASMSLHEAVTQFHLGNSAAALQWWIRAARLRPSEAAWRAVAMIANVSARLRSHIICRQCR